MRRIFLRRLNDRIGNITLFKGKARKLLPIVYDCCALSKEYGFKVNRNSAQSAIVIYFRMRQDDWSTETQLNNFTDMISSCLRFHETDRKVFLRKYSSAAKSIYPKWANPFSS